MGTQDSQVAGLRSKRPSVSVSGHPETGIVTDHQISELRHSVQVEKPTGYPNDHDDDPIDRPSKQSTRPVRRQSGEISLSMGVESQRASKSTSALPEAQIVELLPYPVNVAPEFSAGSADMASSGNREESDGMRSVTRSPGTKPSFPLRRNLYQDSTSDDEEAENRVSTQGSQVQTGEINVVVDPSMGGEAHAHPFVAGAHQSDVNGAGPANAIPTTGDSPALSARGLSTNSVGTSDLGVAAMSMGGEALPPLHQSLVVTSLSELTDSLVAPAHLNTNYILQDLESPRRRKNTRSSIMQTHLNHLQGPSGPTMQMGQSTRHSLSTQRSSFSHQPQVSPPTIPHQSQLRLSQNQAASASTGTTLRAIAQAPVVGPEEWSELTVGRGQVTAGDNLGPLRLRASSSQGRLSDGRPPRPPAIDTSRATPYSELAQLEAVDAEAMQQVQQSRPTPKRPPRIFTGYPSRPLHISDPVALPPSPPPPPVPPQAREMDAAVHVPYQDHHAFPIDENPLIGQGELVVSGLKVVPDHETESVASFLDPVGDSEVMIQALDFPPNHSQQHSVPVYNTYTAAAEARRHTIGSRYPLMGTSRNQLAPAASLLSPNSSLPAQSSPMDLTIDQFIDAFTPSSVIIAHSSAQQCETLKHSLVRSGLLSDNATMGMAAAANNYSFAIDCQTLSSILNSAPIAHGGSPTPSGFPVPADNSLLLVIVDTSLKEFAHQPPSSRTISPSVSSKTSGSSIVMPPLSLNAYEPPVGEKQRGQLYGEQPSSPPPIISLAPGVAASVASTAAHDSPRSITGLATPQSPALTPLSPELPALQELRARRQREWDAGLIPASPALRSQESQVSVSSSAPGSSTTSTTQSTVSEVVPSPSLDPSTPMTLAPPFLQPIAVAIVPPGKTDGETMAILRAAGFDACIESGGMLDYAFQAIYSRVIKPRLLQHTAELRAFYNSYQQQQQQRAAKSNPTGALTERNSTSARRTYDDAYPDHDSQHPDSQLETIHSVISNVSTASHPSVIEVDSGLAGSSVANMYLPLTTGRHKDRKFRFTPASLTRPSSRSASRDRGSGAGVQRQGDGSPLLSPANSLSNPPPFVLVTAQDSYQRSFRVGASNAPSLRGTPVSTPRQGNTPYASPMHSPRGSLSLAPSHGGNHSRTLRERTSFSTATSTPISVQLPPSLGSVSQPVLASTSVEGNAEPAQNLCHEPALSTNQQNHLRPSPNSESIPFALTEPHSVANETSPEALKENKY